MPAMHHLHEHMVILGEETSSNSASTGAIYSPCCNDLRVMVQLMNVTMFFAGHDEAARTMNRALWNGGGGGEGTIRVVNFMLT